MRIVKFSVQNYRSITKAKKLPISESTVLIGPNNEGKSNILRALVATLRLLKSAGGEHTPLKMGRFAFRRREGIYDWDIDFPVSLREGRVNEYSVFIIELKLTPVEIEEFENVVGSRLDGSLPIQVTCGKDRPEFKILKKGRGASVLTKKAAQIAKFISTKLDFVYIPAVRTAQSAHGVVEEILSDELEIVEGNEDFKKALTEISKVQKPVLDQISKSIHLTLKEFLPNVKGVRVEILEEERYKALRRSCEIIIDDGSPTSLRQKGDGVQSLAALSLMKHASERSAHGRSLLLAIEEPESHLHPKAIHQLKQVLNLIAAKSQVIITTHCPIFVDRVNPQANILVDGNKATPANTVESIRNILGVRVSDNLRHAELVLVVEGDDDVIALRALLSLASTKIRQAITSGFLAFESLLGGSNLSYKLTNLKNAICNYYCFLDDDECGRLAFKKAELDGLLSMVDVSFSVCNGMVEAEMEDMYDHEKYSEMIKNRFGVSLDSPKFHTSKKWSVRMHETFRQQGKQWDEQIEKDVKKKIADIVAEEPGDILNVHKKSAFDALVLALEAKMNQTPSKP